MSIKHLEEEIRDAIVALYDKKIKTKKEFSDAVEKAIRKQVNGYFFNQMVIKKSKNKEKNDKRWIKRRYI